MTGILPYLAKKGDAAIMLEIYNGSAPGEVSELASLTMDPAVDPACRAGVSSLQSIISQCWELEPTERPCSSCVLESIAISFQGEGDLGASKDQEAGISSLRIGEDSGHQEDDNVGRRKPRANRGARQSSRGGSRKGRQTPNDVTETRDLITSSPTHPKDETVGKQMAEVQPEPQKAAQGGKKKDPRKAPNDVAETSDPIASSPAHPKGKQMAEVQPEPQKAAQGGKKKDPRKAPNDVAETSYPVASSPAHPKDETVGKQMAEAQPEPQKAAQGGKKKDPRKAPND
ncbi:hypothetical protein FRC01_000872, partial [Tulasnella sp. 417]